MEKFINLGLSESSLKALERKGFEEPTEIQEKTIPILLESKQDVIAQAQTGTGKTAAFGLVFVENLIEHLGHPQAIVLAPTRELAVQVSEEINSLKGDKGLSIVPIYGGQSISLQLKQLKRGVDIVIGTPGRVLDHLERGSLDISAVKYMVLDEADEMLNMGFIEDIEKVLEKTPDDRQLLLFSATMPKRIMSLAKNYMPDYQLIQAKKKQLTNNLVDQLYYEVNRADKFDALCRIIDIEEEFYGIIFCRTKVDVDEVSKKLEDRGYAVGALHGDIAQKQREKVLESFKEKKTMVMVATDVAARGIDVNNLTHVINYSLPQDPESYVHRIGRTGRAGKEGTAITFITPAEFRRLSFIEKAAKTEIRYEKVPEVEDIIKTKKDRIRTDLQNIIEKANLTPYKEIIETTLEGIDRDELLAALLKHTYGNELNVSNYKKIKDVKSASKDLMGKKGKTRLFITMGKRDNMNPGKLVNFIEQSSGVDSSLISNVEVFDVYSFVTAPFLEAEYILESFKKSKKGRRIIVQKASKEKGGGGGKKRGKGGFRRDGFRKGKGKK